MTGDAGTVSVGAVESTTVTSKVSEIELPAASVAVHVTLVVPTGNVEPDAGTQATVGNTPELSLAVTTKVTTTVPSGRASLTISTSGPSKLGGCVSTTLTVRIAVVELPAASTAV